MQSTNEDKAEIYWHRSFWDRPLSGLAMYRGQFVWFLQIDEIKVSITTIEFDKLTADQQDSYDLIDGVYSRFEYFYNFYHLSQEQIDKVQLEHKVFEQQIGKHCNHYPGTYAPFNKIEFTMSDSPVPILGQLLATFSEYDILYMFNYKNVINRKIA